VVTDEATGDPVGGVEVALYGLDDETVLHTTITNGDGSYMFADAPAGEYRLRAGGEWFDGAASWAEATTIDNSVPATADLAIAGGHGSIEGVVTDGADGVGGLPVIFQADGATDPFLAGWTDSDGHFAVDLTPGTYNLYVADLGDTYRHEYWGTTGMTPGDQAATPDFVVTDSSAIDAGTNELTGADCDPAIYHPGASLTAVVGLNLINCDLSYATFTVSGVGITNFDNADLSYSQFVDVFVISSTFNGADLSYSTWDQVDLTDSEFDGADFNNGYLNVVLEDFGTSSSFAGVNFSHVRIERSRNPTSISTSPMRTCPRAAGSTSHSPRSGTTPPAPTTRTATTTATPVSATAAACSRVPRTPRS
jgi:hypothetical protein